MRKKIVFSFLLNPSFLLLVDQDKYDYGDLINVEC